MSGPKVVIFSPLAPALIPVALLIGAGALGAVALANLTANYLEQRRQVERLRQQRESLANLLGRMRSLGLTTDHLQTSIDRVLKRADELVLEGNAAAAVALVTAEINGLEDQRRTAEELLERRVADLQRRFHALPARAAEMQRNAARLETFAQSAVPANWPAAERERLLARAREARASCAAPPALTRRQQNQAQSPA